MAVQAVSDRRLQAILQVIEREDLLTKVPGLRRAMGPITAMRMATPWRDTLIGQLEQRVRAAQQQYLDRPFRPASPNSFVPPGYYVGTEVTSGRRLHRAPLKFTTHTAASGPTGTGKTSWTQGIIHQALMSANPPHVRILDLKDDAPYIASMYDDFVALEPDTEWAPLQPTSFANPEQLSTIFAEVFSATLYSGHRQRAILIEAMRRAYAKYPNPSIQFVHDELIAMNTKSQTYNFRDATDALCAKCDEIRCLYSGLYYARAGLSTERDLCRRSLYMGVRRAQTNIEPFIFTYLLHLLLAHNRFFNIRNQLHTLVLMDEALANLAEDAPTLSGSAPIASIFTTIREFSVGLCLTSASQSHTSRLVLENCALHLVTGCGIEAAEISRNLQLDKAQTEFMTRRLQKGQAILRCTDEPHRDPVLIAFDPLPFEKNVSAADWNRVRARTTALLPPKLPPVVVTAATVIKPVIAPVVPKPALPVITNVVPIRRPGAMVMPAPKIAATPVPSVVITDLQRSFLRQVALHPATPTMPVVQALGLHVQAAERIRTDLEHLGLLESESVLLHSRKGNRGRALRVKPAGYALLGIAKPRGPRGHPGLGLQAEYIIRTLSALIPNCSMEQTIGGKKSVDLCVAVDEGKHQQFLQALDTLGTPLQRRSDFKTGQIIAIEVETSSPRATAEKNVQANAALSLYTVTAVLTADVKSVISLLRTTLSEDFQTTCTVIDALKLIDVLKGEGRQNSAQRSLEV